MRKSLLAVAALMGAGIILPQKAEAFVLRVDKDTSANLVLRQQIRGAYLGKRSNTDKADLQFSVPSAEITISGNVTKQVRFFTTWTASTRPDRNDFNTRFTEGTVILDLGEEFKIAAGVHRLPVWRPYLVSSYNYLAPTGYAYGHRVDVIRPLQQASDVGGASFRHGGLQLWGLVADGMVRYHLGVYDVLDQQSGGQESMYVARLQFTPTMLGFKAEKSYGLSDTYLGRQNVLSIGVGFASQKRGVGGRDGLNRAPQGDKTAKEFVADLFYEQKFGNLVPGFMLAYKDMKDFNGNPGADGKAFIAQGQLLFDENVGLGKPALAVRYSQSDIKRTWDNGRDTTNVGVFVNYYIKGHDAKIQAGVDSVNIKNKPAGLKNYTDFILQLQTQF